MLEAANGLFERKPPEDDVRAVLSQLDCLDAQAYIRLDERSRGWSSGLRERDRPSSFLPWRQDPLEKAWPVFALMSADGFKREMAVAVCDPVNRGEAALLLIRSTDWVEQVQSAAEKRFSRLATAMLVELLPLADHLAESRFRTGALRGLLQQRLDADTLRLAAASADPDIHRVAARRLIESGGANFDELLTFLAAEDPVVRSTAADAALEAPEAERREAAEKILSDSIGWIAAKGLAALVELDGAPAIKRGLDADAAAVRRQALGWAAARGFDARQHYLDRLQSSGQQFDQIALGGLAALSHPDDKSVFLQGVESGPSRLASACLRALANVDPPLGRDKALEAFFGGAGGRLSRTAAFVLKERALTAAQCEAVRDLATNPDCELRLRWRALSILRRYRWLHLATTLDWFAEADGETRRELEGEISVWLAMAAHLGAAPPEELRGTIEAGLWGLSQDQARAINFVLRTAR